MDVPRDLIAPCGLDCFNCKLHERNITENARARFSEAMKIPPEKLPCKGCRGEKGRPLIFPLCPTYACAERKGIEFCFECGEFPCPRLQPAADGAEKYTHNIKLYNLCRMKLVGVDKWAVEEALEIRLKYFKGRFVVGSGPVLD
ncbi:MAG: DUF3795 domain-containing protein [Bacillota bacterium]|jgi:hypothetical protein|nr:DUF3795 domain-containing protein [Thermoanaerobacteraceae bacterium]